MAIELHHLQPSHDDELSRLKTRIAELEALNHDLCERVTENDDIRLHWEEIEQTMDENERIKARIKKLEERIADGDKDFEMATRQNERLIKIVRHHKYKRCLAMAERCKYRMYYLAAVVEQEASKIIPLKAQIQWYEKRERRMDYWKNRWLKLAEKFKEAK